MSLLAITLKIRKDRDKGEWVEFEVLEPTTFRIKGISKKHGNDPVLLIEAGQEVKVTRKKESEYSKESASEGSEIS